jgi:ankyrin repeat protein
MLTRQEEALLEATATGNHRVVLQLISNGVNINVQHPMNKYTPLHWAVKRKNSILVRLLVESGVNTSLEDSNGVTPVEMALEGGDLEVLEILHGLQG